MCSLARVDGYRSAMNAAGLPIDPALIRFGDFHPGGGEAHGRELLALPEPPTAIFAGSDLQALGVIAAGSARRAAAFRRPLRGRLRRHRAVAVDEPAADDRPPAAAADGRGGHAAARCAWRTALRSTTLRMDLATHLVVRGSTASPPPAHARDATSGRRASCGEAISPDQHRARATHLGVQRTACDPRRGLSPVRRTEPALHDVAARAAEAQTISPGSTMRRPSRPVNDARRRAPRTTRARARPAASGTRAYAISRCTGRTTHATGSCEVQLDDLDAVAVAGVADASRP